MEEFQNELETEGNQMKLFVGQIPKDMNEDSLKLYFEEFGPIAEISVIRDSLNMTHKGSWINQLFPS